MDLIDLNKLSADFFRSVARFALEEAPATPELSLSLAPPSLLSTLCNSPASNDRRDIELAAGGAGPPIVKDRVIMFDDGVAGALLSAGSSDVLSLKSGAVADVAAVSDVNRLLGETAVVKGETMAAADPNPDDDDNADLDNGGADDLLFGRGGSFNDGLAADDWN